MTAERLHPGKAPTALLQKLSGGSCLTIDQLATDLGLTNSQITRAAAVLLRRNYLERMAVGCYQLTPEGCAAAAAGEVIRSGRKGPRDKARAVQDSFRQRAWTSMRLQRLFTAPDVLVDAARPSDRDAPDNLRGYLLALAKAGYVKAAPNRAEGGFKRFMLVRNTGPRAPAQRKLKNAIHDFNIGEEVPCIPL